ncbi:MAG: xanthine dehydrogenase family protein molybdopterin-binding subunit [Flexilinea sp.]
MASISKSIRKRDHLPKISGKAKYVDDLKFEGLLHGKILRSTVANAVIRDIQIPNLPEGYTLVDKNDVPGMNIVHIVDDDTPVFSDGTVNYVGEAILMVVGKDLLIINQIMKQIVIVYDELEPVIDMMKSDKIFYQYEYAKGDWETAFKDADRIIEEDFKTGYHEQAYLETQGMIGFYENGKSTVRGSMQCPYYIHTALQKAMGLSPDKVQVIQDETGGAFGGKEDYPSILGCQVAVAAYKTGKPVKVIFDRREDMTCTTKRHPANMHYRAAIKNNKIIGIDADIIFDGGAYSTLSMVVLQRGLICATGSYNFINLHVKGRAVKTNTTPNGAYRGFGGPQSLFAIEMFMDHLAKEFGMDSLELKEKMLVKQGDDTATSGKYHFHVPLPEMIDRIDKITNYRAKKKEYQNQTGRYRKGIGLSMVYHGCGFTGSGERDMIKAVAKLAKNCDDTVEILTAGTDMGQGLETTFSKIVAKTLNIPLDKVIIQNPDTDRVPNSGPTVASRSIMVVGKLLQRAAEKLKKDWKSGEYQEITENYVHPDFQIPWDTKTFQGDAYPDFSWTINVIEVKVDILTATTEIVGAWGIFDIGTPIDIAIINGQLQGGFLQGIGYGSIELMAANNKGVIRNNSFSDYIIPTAMDVPNMVTEIIENPYDNGPFGAKGAGEIPVDGAAPAYVEAMENALGVNLNHTPFSQEDTMKVLETIKK